MDRRDGLGNAALLEASIGQAVTSCRQRGFDYMQRVEQVGKKSVYDYGDIEPMHEARVPGMDDQRRLSVGR